MTNKIVYLATPIESAHFSKEENLKYAEDVAEKLEDCNYTVHRPWKVHIPNAWKISNEEWGRQVFKADIEAINKADIILAICYDRDSSTPGTCWEIGYAYGLGKEIWLVQHESTKVSSLMIANSYSIFDYYYGYDEHNEISTIFYGVNDLNDYLYNRSVWYNHHIKANYYLPIEVK